jgi:hypothetical protein
VGRKKHNSKMRHMGMWFAGHAPHKHRREIDRLRESWRREHLLKRARLKEMFGSVEELMRAARR